MGHDGVETYTPVLPQHGFVPRVYSHMGPMHNLTVLLLAMATTATGSPINCTPHAVNVIVDGEERAVFPKSGDVARLTEDPAEWEDTMELGGVEVPVRSPYTYGGEEGMPADPKSGVIVSDLVARELMKGDPAFPVFSPDTGKLGAVRDNGRIVGTQKLIFWNYERFATKK